MQSSSQRHWILRRNTNETWETSSGCSHRINSRKYAIEQNWWQLSTFTTVSPPFIATGEARSCHSFHSPVTSLLVNATANRQRQTDHRVIRCLLLISEKFHHTYTIWSRYKLRYGAGPIHTAPSHNRVSCTASQSLVRLRFWRTNLCGQPLLCKGITHINLLGTKRMRVGTTTRNISQLVPSMARMLPNRLDYWLIIGLGSQESVGRKYWSDHWIPLIERRNNEPIGAMINLNYSKSLRRNDWSKFGYELLGAWAYHSTYRNRIARQQYPHRLPGTEVDLWNWIPPQRDRSPPEPWMPTNA
jgi:hypothetical protein